MTVVSADNAAAAGSAGAMPRSPIARGERRAILLLAGAMVALNLALAAAGL